jgi:predicted choloylglycine hydrolase
MYMNIQLQMAANLGVFAANANVSVQWVGNAIHLVSATSKGSTVLLFPREFWQRLEGATPEVQEATMQWVRTFVVRTYRTPKDSYAHFIEVPDFLGRVDCGESQSQHGT